MKWRTDNYARCIASGAIVFFNDFDPPRFDDPAGWAFWRRPRGADASTFAGQIIGRNPVGEDEQTLN